MSAWDSIRTPSLRKEASCSIIALRNNSESPILSSSATVHSPSVDWSLLKEPHGGRLRQQPLLFTHSRGHYLRSGTKCLSAQTLDSLSSLIVAGKWESRATAPVECAAVPAPEPCAFVRGSGQEPGRGGKDAQGMSSL